MTRMSKRIAAVFAACALLACFGLAWSSPAAAEGGDPVGALDAVSIRGPYYGSNMWEARGWAADPDAHGQSIAVHLYLDGVGLDQPDQALDRLPPRTGDPRPDVADAFPFAGQNSGWSARFFVQDFAPHTLCAYA